MAELIRGGVMFPGSDRILCSQAITVIKPEALIYLKYIHLVLFCSFAYIFKRILYSIEHNFAKRHKQIFVRVSCLKWFIKSAR